MVLANIDYLEMNFVIEDYFRGFTKTCSKVEIFLLAQYHLNHLVILG